MAQPITPGITLLKILCVIRGHINFGHHCNSRGGMNRLRSTAVYSTEGETSFFGQAAGTEGRRGREQEDNALRKQEDPGWSSVWMTGPGVVNLNNLKEIFVS